MDIQTALIGGITFVVCAGILLFISKFGMKEKSFDEALAEQRKHTTALIGAHKGGKPKEKKVKKSTKKVKEKHPSALVETETAEESEETDSPTSSVVHTQKLHVEFKEPAIIEESSVEESVPNVIHKKEEPSKIDLAKEKSKLSKQNDIVPDGKDKKNTNQNSELDNKENKEYKSKPQAGLSKEKLIKEKQVVVEEIQKSKKQQKLEAVSSSTGEETASDNSAVVSLTNGYVPSTGKEKKKKKNELTLQHLTGSKDADVNLTLLLNAVRKAELSRSEVQILIDLLLNKQHEAPETLDEWSEGKADPVQKLKKQLAEKEKALLEEQQALVGVQAKLREIRSEQTAERVQLQQRSRNLEEALQAKHLELQTINSRLHSQNQKIQQMQVQLNDEAILLRSLREENTGLQLQRQQVDLHLSQAQEADATIQDLQSRNNQLAIELHTLTEQNMAAKEHQQNLIVQLQHQLNHFKGELDEKEGINRQLDEVCRELEHKLNMTHRIETEQKHEVSQLKSVCQQHAEEVRRLEHGKGQALEEVRNIQKQKEELDHTVTQLKIELHKVQEENSELQRIRTNGFEQDNEIHKAELLKLQNELSSTKSEVANVEKKMLDLQENHLSVITDYKTSLTKLHNDLEEQTNKNNELRKKNWKVMDALKAAESRALDTTKQPQISADELSRIRCEEQQTNIKFIQRLFPKIEVSTNVPYDEWVQLAEKHIENYLKDLGNSVSEVKQSEITKLQGQLQRYKGIVVETEGILKKLQDHTEQEEILWRNEMINKDVEMDTIKKQYSEITTKVQHLELQLSVERDAKQKLTEQYEQMKTSQSSAISANSAIIDKLSEEVRHLNHQLSTERTKNVEVIQSPVEASDSSTKLENINSSNGPVLDQEESK